MTPNIAKTLRHKSEVNIQDWDKVHSDLLEILGFVVEFCVNYALPLLITSIIRPKIPGVSKSKTHEEGRAFDISVHGWSQSEIDALVSEVNEAFHVGAISLSDKKEREAVYENGVTAGTAPHIHFQVRKL